MRGYASAQLSPLEPEFRHAPFQAIVQPAPVGGSEEASTGSVGVGSASSALASLILDGLDDYGLAALARRLLPYLRRSADPQAYRGHIAYTVASLATELGVSEKAIRCAIARRELSAVKRGSRWIISAEAVCAWAAPSEARRASRRPSCRTAPKAAGPSPRSVLCDGASRGGAR